MNTVISVLKKMFGSKVRSRRFEYSWILQRINNGVILDVGCVRGTKLQELTKILLERRNIVYGVSLQKIKYSHTRFHYLKGDVLDANYSPEQFDCVVGCHVLQHIGLPYWEPHKKFVYDADSTFFKLTYHWLKPRGKLFLVVPISDKPQLLNYAENCVYRVYSLESLKNLYNGLFLESDSLIFDGAHDTKKLIPFAKALIMELRKR